MQQSNMHMKRATKIKNTITGAHEFTDKDATTYKLKILGRGEELFFQKDDDALICDISAIFDLIDPKSIKSWDNQHKIYDDERTTLLTKIIELYKIAYKDDLELLKK